MPTLQYNEEGWGPYEISETFRDMPYQVSDTIASIHSMAISFLLQFVQIEEFNQSVDEINNLWNCSIRCLQVIE